MGEFFCHSALSRSIGLQSAAILTVNLYSCQLTYSNGDTFPLQLQIHPRVFKALYNFFWGGLVFITIYACWDHYQHTEQSRTHVESATFSIFFMMMMIHFNAPCSKFKYPYTKSLFMGRKHFPGSV